MCRLSRLNRLIKSLTCTATASPDVLVPDRSNEVSVALGRRDRSYPSPTLLQPNPIGRLSAADINGDGFLDLFSSGDRGAAAGAVYLNQGNGAFAFAANTPDTTLTSADLDGDWLADYIGTDLRNILIWPGTGVAPRVSR